MPKTASPRDQIPSWARNYNAGDFPPFAYTADILTFAIDTRPEDVVSGFRALLVTRAKPGPYQGMRAWPGGFVDWQIDANALAAAIRELEEETGLRNPQFIEALDTYDQNGRDPRQFAVGRGGRARGARVVSKAHIVLHPQVDVLLLAREGEDAEEPRFDSVYRHLPWEEEFTSAGRRARRSAIDHLLDWAFGDEVKERRVRAAFGVGEEWNEERAGERFRLLLEAKLVEEAKRDQWGQVRASWKSKLTMPGEPLAFDHRLMLADAVSRLRGKIKYLPGTLAAIMPEEFTLSDLHRAVMALTGRAIEKSNFWRMFRRDRMAGILEPTGAKEVPANRRNARDRRGPEAQLYRFAEDVSQIRFDPAISFSYTNPK